MATFFTEVRQTLVPRGDIKYGPLPPLLVAMTLVTGLVDAFSYLVLGHVFVANMTAVRTGQRPSGRCQLRRRTRESCRLQKRT